MSLSSDTSSRGVVYVATGQAYGRATIASAESLKNSNPDLPICFYTDQDISDGPFDFIKKIDAAHVRSKVDYLWQTPFQQTLYLDADTRVFSPVTGMFDILDRFDLAVAHTRNRDDDWHLRTWKTEIPRSFPQHNCGVMLFKKSDAVVSFLKKWQEAYHEAGFRQDQITFRELLWLSDLRYYVLPAEFNTRKYTICQRVNGHEPMVKIWHLQRWKPPKPGTLRYKINRFLNL